MLSAQKFRHGFILSILLTVLFPLAAFADPDPPSPNSENIHEEDFLPQWNAGEHGDSVTTLANGVVKYESGANGWTGGYVSPPVAVTGWQTVSFYVFTWNNDSVRFELKDGGTTVFDETFNVTGSSSWQLVTVDVSSETPASSSFNYMAVSGNSGTVFIAGCWVVTATSDPPALGTLPDEDFLSEWNEGEHGDAVEPLASGAVKYTPGTNGWTGGFVSPNVDVTGWQSISFYVFAWGNTNVRFELKNGGTTVYDNTFSLTGGSEWQLITVDVSGTPPPSSSINYMAISANSIPVYIGGLWVVNSTTEPPSPGTMPDENFLSQWNEGEHGDTVTTLTNGAVKYAPGTSGWTGGYISPEVTVTNWREIHLYVFAWGETNLRFEMKNDSTTVYDETHTLSSTPGWQHIVVDLSEETPAASRINYLALSSNSIPVYIAGMWVTYNDTPAAPSNLILSQMEGSIFLSWNDNANNEDGFRIYKKTGTLGSFSELGTVATDVTEEYDISVSEGTTYYYYVVAYNASGDSPPTAVRNLTCDFDFALLDKMHAKAAYYAYTEVYANGLVLDIANDTSKASVAATGFGLGALVSAYERAGSTDEWDTSQTDIYNRVNAILDTLLSIQANQASNPSEYGSHGFFYHFIESDATRWGSCEVSAIDNAILLAGVYLAGEYFQGIIASKAQTVIGNCDWTLFYDSSTDFFADAWDPVSGKSDREISYYYNSDEAILIALLAYAQNPTDNNYKKQLFEWTRHVKTYGAYSVYHTFYGGLYMHFFAHCFFDFESLGYDMPQSVNSLEPPVNWWLNSKNAALANRQFSINNEALYSSCGADSWGLSATLKPNGQYESSYGAPPCAVNYGNAVHDGTVTTTAAVSCMPFLATAGESVEDNLGYKVLHELYSIYGENVFSYSSFNSSGEHSASMVGIEILPAAMMIENYRSGLFWNTIMGISVFEDTLPDIFSFEETIDSFLNDLDLEAEHFYSQTGGAIDYKSNASNGATLGGGWGQTAGNEAVYTTYLYNSNVLVLKVLYSDDVAGNVISAYIDDTLVGSFTTVSTGGWNTFAWSDAINAGAITQGTHTIRLTSSGGSYGVNLDIISLTDSSLAQPVITAVTPPDGTSIEYGETLSLGVEATNPNQATLQYQFSVNGDVKQSWATTDTFNVSPYISVSGLYAVFIEVREVGGSTVSGTYEYYVFRNPIDTP
jgi:hypothetical protein